MLDELLPDAYARGRLAGQLGISLDGLSDDEPIPDELLVEPDEAGGSQTFYRVVKAIIDQEKPTLGGLLKKLSGGGGHRIVAGRRSRSPTTSKPGSGPARLTGST